jgi:hypothetical protein
VEMVDNVLAGMRYGSCHEAMLSLSLDSTRHDSVVSTPSSGKREILPRTDWNTNTRLTKAALEVQNAEAEALDRVWAMEEKRRVERLIRASRELGFELPRQCY